MTDILTQEALSQILDSVLEPNIAAYVQKGAYKDGWLCLHVQTLLIQKTIASSRSKGSSLEARKVEKRLTEATTFSMLIISTV